MNNALTRNLESEWCHYDVAHQEQYKQDQPQEGVLKNNFYICAETI